MTNFVEAIRSRDASRLHAPAIEGHLSVACADVANVSYRVDAESNPEAIREAIKRASPSAGITKEFGDVFDATRHTSR